MNELNKKTEELVLRALRASGDEDGRVVGSKLHQNMLQIDPSFDFRAMGYRTFAGFLNSQKNVKITKKSRGPGDVLVEEI